MSKPRIVKEFVGFSGNNDGYKMLYMDDPDLNIQN